LADAVQKKTGVKPQLIKSGGGIFDVAVDGRKIFSKHETGRFPEVPEIIAAIEKTAKK